MKLTTRGRYAVTAMLDLAFYEAEGPVSLAAISGRQGISLSYLEQLFARLRRAGLVASTRGPGGGYRLDRTPDQITVADVIDAVDEPVEYTLCEGKRNCSNNGPCLTHDLWAGLTRHVRGFLAERTLAGLMERPAVRAVAERQSGRQPLRPAEEIQSAAGD